MDEKWCPACETTKPITEFYRNKGRADGLSGYCVECQRAAENARRLRERLRITADLGGRCSRCGFDDPRALQIDHTHGGGSERRKTDQANTNATRFYQEVRAHPDDYSLLCANCNWIKRAEQVEIIGKRIYERTVPTERRQGEGRWSARANARRSVSARESWTPEKREEKAEAMRQKATGRKLVMGEDGKRHWVYPDAAQPV